MSNYKVSHMNSIHKDQAKYLFSLPWFRRWQWIHRFIKCIILNWILLHMIYMMLGLLGSKLKFSFQTVFFSLLLKELINIFSFPFNFCLLSSRVIFLYTLLKPSLLSKQKTCPPPLKGSPCSLCYFYLLLKTLNVRSTLLHQ